LGEAREWIQVLWVLQSCLTHHTWVRCLEQSSGLAVTPDPRVVGLAEKTDPKLRGLPF